MSHGGGGGGAVMRNIDGSDMSKKQVLIKRRGAFKWLPAIFSNDLVHGSWWFVAGSAAMTLFAVVPLIQPYIPFYNPEQDDLLPTTDFDVTWALTVFSGFFFTLGSAAFVRAFEEPSKRPLFYYNKHFQTDELLAAWLFLWGTVPTIPFTLIFFIVDPSSVFLGAVFISIMMVFGCVLFVVACYPSDKKRNNYVMPFCLRYCGTNMWVVKHLANDWLSATWFFLVANILGCFISFIFLFEACASGNQETIFIWLSGSVEAFLFLIGSLYFVAGSYPHASQFYYAEGRNATGQTFEESQGIVVSRIDPTKGTKTKVDLGMGKRSSVVAQHMEGRDRIKMSAPSTNPMHKKGDSTTPIKTRAPLVTMGRGGNSKSSPVPSPYSSAADLMALAAGSNAVSASSSSSSSSSASAPAAKFLATAAEDDEFEYVEEEVEEDEEVEGEDDDSDEESKAPSSGTTSKAVGGAAYASIPKR